VGVAIVSALAADLKVPGHVEANGYTQVPLKATASGSVTSFTAELGAIVRKGQVLGQLFAPDVADQQRIYLSMRAELDAVHARLTRTEQLVKLGSVSQQELEAVRASHTTHATDVEGVRARLILLGVSAGRLDKLTSAADINANTDIVAPANGTVIRRTANAGLNVQVGEELVTIADLSQVWVVADVFERDLGRVTVGSRIVITTPAEPGAAWNSTISYLDPQVVPETRTARLRADVQNPAGRLKLGQYVDVTVAGIKASVVQVPREAVQTIADRHFVYVPDPSQADRFLEREVRIGSTSEMATEILSGLAGGDRVVIAGSFFLRAERDRLGLPLPSPAQVVRYDVAITPQGFEPDRITINRNVPVELRFTRQTDATCAKAVSIPALKLKQDLPLNVGVVVSIPPQAKGEIEFVCGMNMLKGTVVVR
jgi:RND family efflux transporter MFP subunit